MDFTPIAKRRLSLGSDSSVHEKSLRYKLDASEDEVNDSSVESNSDADDEADEMETISRNIDDDLEVIREYYMLEIGPLQFMNDQDLRLFFESEIRRLPMSQMQDSTINRRLLLGNGEVIPLSKYAQIILDYKPVFLYLEAMRESGVTNMLSQLVYSLLFQRFKEFYNKDILMACWTVIIINPTLLMEMPGTRNMFREAQKFTGEFSAI